MLRTITALCLLTLPVTAALADDTAPRSVDQAAPVDQTAATTGQAALPADQAAMKAHVMFLASDAMRGREAGSPEFDIAAQYVASRFYAAGLTPGGDAGSFLQTVPLVTYKAAGQGDLVWSDARGVLQPLAFGTDFVPAANPARALTSVSAPVVFVGYGIVAPQYGQDDYRGVDVRGKIVAYFGGAPKRFGGEERAYFGSGSTKASIAADHGAIGVLNIETPGARGPGFARMVQFYDTPRMTWATPAGVGKAGGAPVLGTISQAGAARLFVGAKLPWSKIAAESAKDAPRYRAMPLKGSLAAVTRTSFAPAASSNVIGIIPGTDPVVGKQVVVLSAHLDHLGMRGEGKTPGEDRINNGALDNAIGIASLIEEAKRFTASGQAPKRTVMFLAVTGEEKGLVGSDYFTNHPTVPLKSIVADVNLDMPILTYKFEDMIVFGAERSTLGPIVRDAVGAIGVSLSPDPMPDEGIFVRSDHFRFVQKGIPSVFLWPGQKGPGKAAVDHFMTTNYHKPSDDLSQPILWDQGTRFVDVNYRIARAIADGAAAPVWNKGDYFGTTYKGPMAR